MKHKAREALLSGDILRELVGGTAEATGEAFFRELVRHLAKAMQVSYAFISELDASRTKIRTLALWADKGFADNIEYELAGTPCADVAKGEVCFFSEGIQARFPDDSLLVDMEAESYLGIPFFDPSGTLVGHMAILDREPMPEDEYRLELMRIFAGRAGAELQRKRVEEALRKSQESLMEAQRIARMGHWDLDLVKNELVWSDEVYRIFEMKPEKFGASYEAFLNTVHPDDRKEVDKAYMDSVRNRTPYDIEHRLRMQDDSVKWVNERCETFYGDDSTPLRSIGTVQDITDRKEVEFRLEHMASHDNLTGLPNRVLFFDRLSQALAQARRHKQTFAVLFLDLDNFKTVNDALGHHVGDQLLRDMSQRLLGCVREMDTVARMGGDEFTCILTEVHNTQGVALVAEKMLKALSKPFEFTGHVCRVGCSIGIAMYPDHGKDDDTLVNHADAAMYVAKRQGKQNYQFFNSAEIGKV